MSNLIVPPPLTEQQVTEEKRRDEVKDITPIGTKADGFKYNKDYHQMADFLGLQAEDKMDEELAGKIAQIRDWIDEKDELEAMIKIKTMIRELGVSVKGKELVIELYKFAKLAKQREEIDKKISLLKNE